MVIAARFGFRGHVLQHRARHPLVGDVAGAVARLRFQEYDVRLDDHPGARLDLGFQASGARLAVLDGAPHHVAHEFVVQRMLRRNRFRQALVRRLDQADARFVLRHPEQRRGGGSLHGTNDEFTTADTPHALAPRVLDLELWSNLRPCPPPWHGPTQISTSIPSLEPVYTRGEAAASVKAQSDNKP